MVPDNEADWPLDSLPDNARKTRSGESSWMVMDEWFGGDDGNGWLIKGMYGLVKFCCLNEWMIEWSVYLSLSVCLFVWWFRFRFRLMIGLLYINGNLKKLRMWIWSDGDGDGDGDLMVKLEFLSCDPLNFFFIDPSFYQSLIWHVW
jgi:hypothetical protein